MSERAGVKRGAGSVLLSVLTEGACLLLLGWGGAEGMLDAERLLPPMLLAAALSAAVGALLLRRWGWSAFWAALLIGPGVQLLLMGAGRLAFGSAGWDGQRWLLPLVSFSAALLMGLLPRKRRTGKRGKRR